MSSTEGTIAKRRCVNCPKTYQPRENKQRFCCDNCRKEFHKYGGTFPKLKAKMDELIRARVREVSPDAARMDALEARVVELEKWRKG